jgi:glycosyltransferase involved in cell wall biosynthesis
MEPSPLVTIAIPTHNRAESYLRYALSSALAQTYSNIEIIVSDNASNDGTTDLVRQFSDPRVRYFKHSVNIGATNNYNYCLERAHGQYFLLLQDDDAIDSDFISYAIRVVKSFPRVGVIRTGVRLIGFDGQVIKEYPNPSGGLATEAFFLQWFSGRTPVYLCNTMFSTEELRQIGGFRSKHNCYDDTMAIMQLAARCGRADLGDIKASFRIHPGELGSQARIDDWCEDSIQLLQLMCQLVPLDQVRIRNVGLHFFSNVNFARASAIRPPLKRLSAYIRIIRYFEYRHWPSLGLLIRILDGTRLHAGLRVIKRGCKLAWHRA